MNGSPSWLLLAGLGMTLLGAILLTPAIRSIERQGAHPVDRDQVETDSPAGD